MPVTTVPRFEDPAFSVDALNPSNEPIWGVAPRLNFDNNDGQLFMFNNANEFVFANEAMTLEQLIVKSMITERLTYNAYDKEFGSDFWTILGRGLSELAVQSVAEIFTREALGNIDLIRFIDQFVTSVHGDQLYITFRVVTVSGHERDFSFARTIR
jgi:hypothetical protein